MKTHPGASASTPSKLPTNGEEQNSSSAHLVARDEREDGQPLAQSSEKREDLQDLPPMGGVGVGVAANEEEERRADTTV